MFSNTREKALAGILAGSVALFGGYDVIDRVFLAPTQTVKTQVQAVAARNQALESDFALVEHAQKNLKQVRALSLPADPSVASLVYQDWLLAQMKKAGLYDAVVTPGQPIPEESVGHRIPFTIQATNNLRQIGRFLDTFYASPLLHRITFMTISNAGSSSDSQRKLVLSLEGLALQNATTADSMPDTRRIVSTSSNAKLEYAFSRNDPFRRTVIKPVSISAVAKTKPKAKPTSPAKPKIDELITVRLVASILKQGKPEAWFFDTRTNKEFIVAVGEEIRLADFSGRVVSIAADSITLASNDKSHTTKLGETLRESMKQTIN